MILFYEYIFLGHPVCNFFCMLAECICMFNWNPLNPVLLLFMYSAHSAQFQINLFIFRFANFFTAITWHWQPCWIPQLQWDFKVYWCPIKRYTTLHSNYSSSYRMVVGFIHILIVNYKTWPIHFACFHGASHRIIQALLDADKQGWTGIEPSEFKLLPLHLAIIIFSQDAVT